VTLTRGDTNGKGTEELADDMGSIGGWLIWMPASLQACPQGNGGGNCWKRQDGGREGEKEGNAFTIRWGI